MSVIPSALQELYNRFWDANVHFFNLTQNQGCGEFTEAFVEHAQNNGFPKVGHLKKSPSQTQWNGHANDAFLYNEPDPTLLRAVDIIGAAESTDPHNPPRKNWGIDDPRYTEEFWLKEPHGEPTPSPNMVPWVSYFGDTSNAEFKRVLAYDYARRPQGADWDVSVWAFRVVYTALMGLTSPQEGGHPLGLDGAREHHRPEWCAALGVPVVPVPPTWNIGDPV